MMALILTVALQQASSSAEFMVRATVVRPACVVMSEAGTARWMERRRPGPDSVLCTHVTGVPLPPPRIVTLARVVEGSRQETLEIEY